MEQLLTDTEPRVTVLMPVFNAEKFLLGAIDSILGQTFSDFELLVIDDGSTDRSVEIVDSVSDARVHCIINPKHHGLVAVLNQGLRLIKSKYIARMDADDISLPDRLAKQVRYLDDHPEVGVCGAAIQLIGQGKKDVVHRPTDAEEIKAGSLFANPVFHPTVMMRTEFIRRFNLHYDFRFGHAEDYEFWSRCLRYFPVGNLKEALLLYRQHEGQVAKQHRQEQIAVTKMVYRRLLSDLGVKVDKESLTLHWQIGARRFKSSEKFLSKTRYWFTKLFVANYQTNYYSHEGLSLVLDRRWLDLCAASWRLGWVTWREYWRFPPKLRLSFIPKVGLLIIKCFLAWLRKLLGRQELAKILKSEN